MDKWQQAIDNQMVICHLGIAKDEDDPEKLLNMIIDWHVDVNLDPAISSRAHKLMVDGLNIGGQWGSLDNSETRELIKNLLEVCDEGMSHTDDCMTNYYSNVKCTCQKGKTMKQAREWLDRNGQEL